MLLWIRRFYFLFSYSSLTIEFLRFCLFICAVRWSKDVSIIKGCKFMLINDSAFFPHSLGCFLFLIEICSNIIWLRSTCRWLYSLSTSRNPFQTWRNSSDCQSKWFSLVAGNTNIWKLFLLHFHRFYFLWIFWTLFHTYFGLSVIFFSVFHHVLVQTVYV